MDEQLQRRVRESGHNLHLQVAKYLGDEDWQIELASYYVDDLSDKPREIDIVAEMPYTKGSVLDGSLEEVMRTRLFIECKYFKTPIAVRTLPYDISEAHEAVVSHGLRASSDIFRDWHHYASPPRVGKLWTTMDDRNDQFFDGLASCAKSLLYYMGTRASRGLFYPVLVYDGIEGLFEVEGSDLTNLAEAPLTKNVLVSFNYAYTEVFTNKPKRRRLFIDVVHREELHKLLSQINTESIRAVGSIS